MRWNLAPLVLLVVSVFFARSTDSVLAASGQSIVQSVASAFAPGGSVVQLTLTGTVTSYAGGKTDSGTVALTGLSDGSGSLALSVSGGAYAETLQPVGFGRNCEWVDSSGTAHAMESSSCAVPLEALLPSLALQPSATYYDVTDEGVGTLNSAQVRLLSIVPSVAMIGSVGVVQVGLDPNTLLPSVVEYVIHPDANPMATVKVDVIFSNYTLQNGVEVPQSIQRRLNGALNLDIQIQSSSLSNP
jgi:hypothetical protein